MSMYNSLPGLITAGALSVMLTVLVFSRNSIPFITEYRNATIILFVLGLLMCTLGAMGYILTKSVFSPVTLAGSLLGVLAIAIGVLAILNKPIPFLQDERQAFMVLAGIILIKVILARIQLFVLK